MARTGDRWKTGNTGTYIETVIHSGYDLLINGSNHYINFNTTVGSGGYGFRDNAGVMEAKNSSGAWGSIVTSTSGGIDLAAVSAASTTAPLSLYTMTSAVDVEFRTSTATSLLYLKESTAQIGIGTSSPTAGTTVHISASSPTLYFTSTDGSGVREAIRVVGPNSANGGMFIGAVSGLTSFNPIHIGGNTLLVADGNVARVGVGTNSPSLGKFHIVATTTQLATAYDGSNYFTATVGSTGATTFAGTGSGASFRFDNAVTVSSPAGLTSAITDVFNVLGNNAANRAGIYIQNQSTTGQTTMYLDNNRGSFASYGGFFSGGATNALSNILGLTRADKVFFIADGASNLGLGIGTLQNVPVVLGSNNAEIMRLTGVNVGIGTGATVSAKAHILATTEQLRVGYDSSNYLSTTVGSTGAPTFNTVGAGGSYNFQIAGTSEWFMNNISLRGASGNVFAWTSANADSANDTGLSRISATVVGVGNGTASDVTGTFVATKYAIGGTTSSFPMLKRSSTTMQVRLADDSAYAVLEALGGTTANSVAVLDATQTLTNKRITQRVTTITSSATPTINTDNCDDVTITALATAITSMTSNLSGTPTNFQNLRFRIKDDGTARAITWGASFAPMGVALPTTTVISKVLTVGFIYDTVAMVWGCVASAQEA